MDVVFRERLDRIETVNQVIRHVFDEHCAGIYIENSKKIMCSYIFSKLISNILKCDLLEYGSSSSFWMFWKLNSS